MNKKVLVVDDDALFRQGLASVLIAKGFTVEEAGNGQEGLKKALEEGVDLVVTDVQMPQLDGLQMLDKLRQDEHGKAIPVIILSVDEKTESINQALTAGVTVYLSKTNFDVEAMATQIAAALKQ